MNYNEQLRKRLETLNDNDRLHLVNAQGDLEVFTAIELRQKLDAENARANGGEPVGLPADERPQTVDSEVETEEETDDGEEDVSIDEELEKDEKPAPKKKTPAKAKKKTVKKKAPAKKK